MHKNWKFHHVSVVVKDMDKAMEFYKSLGVGPFPPLIGPEGKVTLVNKTAMGQDSDYEIDLRHAEGGIGDLAFEVIQPLEGDTPVKEFLNKKGEGIQHIGFYVDDLDKEATILAEKGFKISQSGESPAVKWAYFDTDKVGGVSIELMQKK
jgi:catechol 2,3-dioxygenase-like lactoylglutathione lyase family enzyme